MTHVQNTASRRVLCLLLALLMALALVQVATPSANAAYNSALATAVSAKLPLVTYAMPSSGASKVYSYSDSSLGSQTKSYYIDTFKDQIVITKISSNGKAVYVTYPSTSSSTGYRSRWFATDDILGLASVSVSSYTATAKTTTYRMSSSSAVASYGSIAAKDACVKLGSRTVGSTTYYPTIYPISSATYNKVSGVKYKLAMSMGESPIVTSSWQWPVKSYSISQSFGHYSTTKAKVGRPYHAGIDLTGNTAIYAAADGTVKYKGFSESNGYHVILQHTLNGTTVYSLYSHLSSYSNCPAVGKTVSKGTRIGTMGNTGNSTGTHLHFGVFTTYSSDPYGYGSKLVSSNKVTQGSYTFYNPAYIISNGKLP